MNKELQDKTFGNPIDWMTLIDNGHLTTEQVAWIQKGENLGFKLRFDNESMFISKINVSRKISVNMVHTIKSKSMIDIDEVYFDSK